jgi:SAM-dependent methyltransferase
MSAPIRVLPTMHRLMLERALERIDLSSARSVLVVGAGDDPYRRMLPDAQRYITVDLNARRRAISVVADGDSLPARASAFDCVICVEVLEHVRRPEDVVRELARVLRPGGVAVTTTPFMFHIHADPNDLSRFTASRLGELFAGFTSVEITPFGSRVFSIWDLVTTAYAPRSPLAPLRVVNNLARLKTALAPPEGAQHRVASSLCRGVEPPGLNRLVL